MTIQNLRDRPEALTPGGARVSQRGTAGGTNGSAQSFGSMLHERMADAANQTAQTAGMTAAVQTAAPAAAQTVPAVNFSRHALARAEERGIELTPALMDRLADSVERAQEKGAKNILAFDAQQAFIINIPHGRVITTISQAEMRENIFTNIDGAVLL